MMMNCSRLENNVKHVPTVGSKMCLTNQVEVRVFQQVHNNGHVTTHPPWE
jgi:hypothetical protein